MRVHFLAKKRYMAKINRANISYAKKNLRENFPNYGMYMCPVLTYSTYYTGLDLLTSGTSCPLQTKP